MLGPREPDDYLLPTERRVIRVRRHWAALMLVLAKTLGLLVTTVGLSYTIDGGVELGLDAHWLVTLGALSLMSLVIALSALGALVLKWFGALGPVTRFGEGLQKSLAKRFKVALLTPVVVIGVAWILQQFAGVQGVELVQTVLWYVALLAVLYFGYHVLEWWVERIIVTDKRFMLTSGILETKISLMPITKVTDMSYTRPLVGRMFGYGTLRVESAGQKQDLEKIVFLPRPEEVYDAISELIFGEKGDGRKPSLAPPREKLKRRR